MYHIKVNQGTIYDVELDSKGITLNNELKDISFASLGNNQYHILLNQKSYNVELVSINHENKTASLKVNNRIYDCEIKDQFDDLLQSLGLDNLNAKKINDIKAPMPGLVLKVLVTEGQEFKKGDNLLVLEAMKMENILKSPTDGVVKSIKIKPGDKVDKNEVLILLA
ncbi:MAG: acetyl-CoA carboxylase biotin carboxyl carrier protein subunit [Sphingobacteriales bacterium]|jgi:biotin carboxyl carrier protein|nr:acetyl-CoA carboxylase biotin carboxyl carrier protein subunit [Sphingobacteriales bacterium]